MKIEKHEVMDGTEGGWFTWLELVFRKGEDAAMAIAEGRTVPMMRDNDLPKVDKFKFPYDQLFRLGRRVFSNKAFNENLKRMENTAAMDETEQQASNVVVNVRSGVSARVAKSINFAVGANTSSDTG